MGNWDDQQAGRARDRAAKLRREGRDSSAAEADAIYYERRSLDEDARRRDLEREQREETRRKRERTLAELREIERRMAGLDSAAADDDFADDDDVCEDDEPERDEAMQARDRLFAMLEKVGYYKPAAEVILNGAPSSMNYVTRDPELRRKLVDHVQGKWSNWYGTLWLSILCLIGALIWSAYADRNDLAAYSAVGLLASCFAHDPLEKRAKSEAEGIVARARRLVEREWGT